MDGTLEVTLEAAATMVPWNEGERFAYTYNGATPGPTLRVRPGGSPHDPSHELTRRTHNLHTHGLRVSPEGASDDVLVTVAPGEERTYVYEIPADHPEGDVLVSPTRPRDRCGARLPQVRRRHRRRG
ncbi:MAG: multicopper oxidase domain-containing protein [Ilumatobacteraceae bacterium]